MHRQAMSRPRMTYLLPFSAVRHFQYSDIKCSTIHFRGSHRIAKASTCQSAFKSCTYRRDAGVSARTCPPLRRAERSSGDEDIHPCYHLIVISTLVRRPRPGMGSLRAHALRGPPHSRRHAVYPHDSRLCLACLHPIFIRAGESARPLDGDDLGPKIGADRRQL